MGPTPRDWLSYPGRESLFPFGTIAAAVGVILIVLGMTTISDYVNWEPGETAARARSGWRVVADASLEFALPVDCEERPATAPGVREFRSPTLRVELRTGAAAPDVEAEAVRRGAVLERTGLAYAGRVEVALVARWREEGRLVVALEASLRGVPTVLSASASDPETEAAAEEVVRSARLLDR
jgi:hypothetical protein